MKAHKQQLALAHGKDMRARSAKRAGLSVEIPEVAMEAHMDTKACKVRRLPSRHAQLRPRIRSCLRLRRSAQERGFHAYVRHLALENFPEIAAQLPLARALKLAGPRLQSKNLWIGDGTNCRTHSIE